MEEEEEETVGSDMFDCIVLGGYELGDIERNVQENSIGYIAGFIVKMIQKKEYCEQCSNSLLAEFDGGHCSASNLVFMKQKGGLILASSDVVSLCIKANDVVEAFSRRNGIYIDKKIECKLLEKVIEIIDEKDLFPYLMDHDASHKKNLISKIILNFIRVKKFAIVRRYNDQRKSDVRKKLNHLAKYC